MTFGSKRCLLLVDDDPRNLMALDAILSPHGHRLVHASDGAAALEKFETEAPDIVLCDLVMPKMDGLEVLGRIRVHAERSHTPVIMITGHAEREHRLKALRAGADEFLEKPLDEAILTARLNTLLMLKQSRDELASRHSALAKLQGEQRELVEFIVHDITAPVKSLKSSIDWVEEHFDEGIAIARPTFAEMRTALERVGVMIDDLSWVSRLESCTLPVRRANLALNDLVEQAVARVSRVAASRDIRLDVECEEHVAILADAGLLARVLDNLLDNALRYTPPGGRVRVELRRDDGAEVRICNDGPAIPVDERSRIFEKFARGAAEPPSPGNPGLGLYFCKRAIGAHQGELRVVDLPGWPTSFSLWLPESTPPRLPIRVS